MVATLSERLYRVMSLSSSVRCDDDQFPELAKMLDEACRRLDIPYRPELFLTESPVMNAMTLGVEEPIITVHSALLDQMSDAEVTAVLGHEMGHLHSDHVLYKAMAQLLLAGGGTLSGAVKLLTYPVRLALQKWSRCAELTADRAGLLSVRDLGVVLQMEMKFAGGTRPGTTSRTALRLDSFVRQARELTELEASSWWDSVLATLVTIHATHPFVAWRVMHLLEWVESGNYLDILAGNYPQVDRSEAAEVET